MSEPRRPGRIDLRALEHPTDPERLIHAAIARARFGPRVIPWLASRWRPTLVTAAAIVLVALSLLWRAPRPWVAPVASVVDWISENRAPTNGEILSIYGGTLR